MNFRVFITSSVYISVGILEVAHAARALSIIPRYPRYTSSRRNWVKGFRIPSKTLGIFRLIFQRRRITSKSLKPQIISQHIPPREVSSGSQLPRSLSRRTWGNQLRRIQHSLWRSRSRAYTSIHHWSISIDYRTYAVMFSSMSLLQLEGRGKGKKMQICYQSLLYSASVTFPKSTIF